MKRHVTCFVEKGGFEPRTVGTKAERYDHCATSRVWLLFYKTVISSAAAAGGCAARVTAVLEDNDALICELLELQMDMDCKKIDYYALKTLENLY